MLSYFAATLRLHVNNEILFLLSSFTLVFMLISLSSILNSGVVKFGHIVPYVVTPLLFILVPYNITKHIGSERFVHYLFLGASMSAIYSIIHFISLNLVGLKIELFLPFIKEEGARFVFVERQRAFHPEPGVAAYYFATMGCLKIFLKQLKTKTDVILQIVIVLAMLLSFSPLAAIMLILIFTFMIFDKTYRKIGILLFVMFFCVVLLVIPSEVLIKGFDILIAKVSLSSNSYSASDRMSRWLTAFTYVENVLLLGFGAGSTTVLFGSSFTSSFLTLLFEGGLIASIMFALIVFRLPVEGKLSLLYPSLIAILFITISSAYYIGYVFILRVLLMRRN